MFESEEFKEHDGNSFLSVVDLSLAEELGRLEKSSIDPPSFKSSIGGVMIGILLVPLIRLASAD